jgi:glycosyltransferase involved in cell wall biosynthesis
MLNHPRFRRADLVIYHWGIAYDLFDSLVIAPALAHRCAVHFHNVTPVELLTGPDRAKGERSILQAQLVVDASLRSGAEVWTYSEYNRRTLLQWGVPAGRLFDVPIAITRPNTDGVERAADRVDLLTVGRLVPAKGHHVLVAALAMLPDTVRAGLTLTIAGSVRLSDPDYVADLRRQIIANRLAGVVAIVDDPDDAELGTLYGRSHVVVSPSFHEGLCVPVIEGYLAGCRAIGTTSGNLPFLVQAPDPVVATGDPAALAEAITQVAGELLAGAPVDDTAGARRASVAGFSPERAAAALRQRLLDAEAP